MSIESAAGTGSAHDATAIASNDIKGLEEALVRARAEEEASLPARHLAALETRKARLLEDLAVTEEQITAAKQEGN